MYLLCVVLIANMYQNACGSVLAQQGVEVLPARVGVLGGGGVDSEAVQGGQLARLCLE